MKENEYRDSKNTSKAFKQTGQIFLGGRNGHLMSLTVIFLNKTMRRAVARERLGDEKPHSLKWTAAWWWDEAGWSIILKHRGRRWEGRAEWRMESKAAKDGGKGVKITDRLWLVIWPSSDAVVGIGFFNLLITLFGSETHTHKQTQWGDPAEDLKKQDMVSERQRVRLAPSALSASTLMANLPAHVISLLPPPSWMLFSFSMRSWGIVGIALGGKILRCRNWTWERELEQPAGVSLSQWSLIHNPTVVQPH